MNSSSANTAGILHKTVATSLVVVALLLNIVCIMLSGRIAYRKPQWPNVLVVHINITDVCMILLVIIPGAVALHIPVILNQVYFCQYQGTVLNLWYILEFILLVQIMFDRCFAISHPFIYSQQILHSKAIIWSNAVFAGVATVSILIACVPLATRVEFVAIGPGLCFWDISQDNVLPTLVINVAITFVVLAVLGCLTGGISIGVLNMLRRAHDSGTDNTRKNVNKTEVNFAKLAIITSLVFGASSVPFTVVLILEAIGQYVGGDVQYIALCILMVNVLLNPLLHSAIRRPVRRALLVLVKWLLYITLCCRSSLRPKTQIDEALGLANKPPPVIISSNQAAGTTIKMTSTENHEIRK